MFLKSYKETQIKYVCLKAKVCQFFSYYKIQILIYFTYPFSSQLKSDS